MDNKKLKNVPNIRFSEFNYKWQTKILGDFSIISSGGTPSRTNHKFWGGDIPWITTSQINFETIDHALQFISTEGLKSSSAKLFPKGSILMALYGQGPTRGKVAILGIEAATNQACAVIIPDVSHASSTYVFYELERRYKSLRNLSNDGSQKNLTSGLIKSLSLKLPQKEEQIKIASFLKAVDEKIIIAHQKIDLLKLYKEGVLQAIFSKKIRFKNESGKDYPNWVEKSFGEVYAFLRTNSLTRAQLNETGEIKNIHYGDIHTRLSSNFDSKHEVLSYLSTSTNADYCEPGDLIIADASEDRKDIGKSIEIINTNNDRIVAGLHTYLSRPKLDNISVGFSGYLMQSREVKKQLHRIATGASVLGISKVELSNIILKIPLKEEQKKIAHFLTVIDAEFELEIIKLELANKFKKALLQQMFV